MSNPAKSASQQVIDFIQKNRRVIDQQGFFTLHLQVQHATLSRAKFEQDVTSKEDGAITPLVD